ncbi:MAG: hypothetical protein AAGD18_18495 [Actinomycetota bacterium]
MDQVEPDEQTREPSRLGSWWPLGVGALAAVVLTAIVIVGSGGDDRSFPDEWDAAVLPFVEFVEEERELEFLHPVEVRFLTDEEFEADVTADEAELTDEDRAEIDETTELFRAFGLIEGELDLFAATNDLTGEGTLGFYRFDDQSITMRGTELTPFVQLTLVHELTHALQDQHFEIGDRFLSIDVDDSVSGAVLTAVVEGDAQRVEFAYRETLPGDELDDLVAEEDANLADFEEGIEEVPTILQTFFATPYVYGEAMLAVVDAIDGTEGIDELLRNPPPSEEALLDPWILAGDEDPIEVETPALADDEEEIDAGEVGSPSWLLLLAERVDVDVALEAADGWGGDAYVAFRRDGVVCVRVDWQGDTEADVAQMRGALDAWVAAGPDGAASVEDRDGGLRFESCDPGEGAEGITRDASEAALVASITRTYAGLGFFEGGATVEEARCVGDGILDIFDLDDLQDPEYEPTSAEQSAIFGVVDKCVGG